MTERMLPDGRCLVRVVLHTEDALTWVVPFDPGDLSGPGNQFGNNDLLFGARAADVLAGAEPALGDATLTLSFVTPECGAPLPDFYQLVFFPEPGQEIRQVRLVGGATGAFADGSEGRVRFTQVGLFNTGFNGAVADGFPVERITLIPTGGGVLGSTAAASPFASGRPILA